MLDRLSLASMLRSLFPYIVDGCPLCDSPDCFEGACTRTEQTDDGATRPQTSTPCLRPPSLLLPRPLQPEVGEENEETAQLPETNDMPSAARWGCLWDFRRITRPSGLAGSAKFWSLASAIAHDPVAEEAMKHMLANDRVSMKAKSHQGAVWRNRRWVDDGNWIYAALWCAVVVESRSDSIVKHLVFRWPSLQPTHGLSFKAIELMGDCIENMLAEALLTGPAIPTVIRTQREQLMKLVRDFGDTIVALDHLLVVEDGPPRSRDRPCPWTFGVLTFWARNGDLHQVAIIGARMAGSCRHVSA